MAAAKLGASEDILGHKVGQDDDGMGWMDH